MGLSRYVSSITVAIALMFIISGLQTSLTVNAQQMNFTQQQQQVPFTNFTGSIPLANSLLEVVKSKITVSLIDAMNNVTKSLGPNATVLAGSIQPEVGFLVYKIAALDGNNTVHLVTVDPGNGSVLSQQQSPAAVSRIFSEIRNDPLQLNRFPGLENFLGINPSMRLP
jgi:hypothetical protein